MGYDGLREKTSGIHKGFYKAGCENKQREGVTIKLFIYFVFVLCNFILFFFSRIAKVEKNWKKQF